MPIQYRYMKGKDLTYRQIEEKDIPQVLELGRKLHEAVRPGYYEFSEEELLRKLVQLLTREDRTCFVCFDDDHAVGVFFCAASLASGSPQLEASEMGVYILPAYRKKGIMKQFFVLFEEWAKSLGCVVSSFNDSMQQLSQETVQRLGYKKHSIVYRKEL